MIGAMQQPSSHRRGPFTYRLYGLVLRSELPLPYPELREPHPNTADLFEAPDSFFAQARQDASGGPKPGDWVQHERLSDGSDYLRWSGLFEFLVSPEGRRIACRSCNGTTPEVFHTYLAGNVLSFALLKQGLEPLHATVVVVDQQAVAFLGDSGYGKSSLGAAFLRAGHTLLTDDLLVITESDRRFTAHPGPPRIKLFPEVARAVLGDLVAGTPMNPTTPKLVIPLTSRQSSQAAAPLRAIYMLRPPSTGAPLTRVRITPLSQRRACLDLIANTYNTIVVEPARLARQFNWTSRLPARIPVKSLSYPHDLAFLPEVLAAIESDLNS